MNPVIARNLLNSSSILIFKDEREKLSSFKTKSGRELALIEENHEKVSLYVEVYPVHMPEVTMDKTYEPTTDAKGRHSNLQYISSKLGFEHKTYKLHIKTETALITFLNWYQYA